MLFSRGSKPEQNSLAIPDAATKDPKAFELLRVWITNEAQHVSIRSDVWDDPRAWGIMLADLARHVANAYHQNTGADPNAVLHPSRDFFDAEVGSPTDEPSGQVLP